MYLIFIPGGFLPKGSGAIDEYFGVYRSTPPGPALPHLTTSMQLDVIKDIDGEFCRKKFTVVTDILNSLEMFRARDELDLREI